jgi:hypothetical protein
LNIYKDLNYDIEYHIKIKYKEKDFIENENKLNKANINSNYNNNYIYNIDNKNKNNYIEFAKSEFEEENNIIFKFTTKYKPKEIKEKLLNFNFIKTIIENLTLGNINVKNLYLIEFLYFF